MADDETGLSKQGVDGASVSDNRAGTDSDVLPELLKEAEDTFAWLAQLTFASTEDRDLHDTAYRRLYYIFGFCRIAGLDAIARTIHPALKALDIGRRSEDFTANSLDYVIRLSLEAARKLARNVSDPGFAPINEREIIEECERYLAPLLESNRSIAPSPIQVTETKSEPPHDAENDAPHKPEPAEIDDAPEELDLSAAQLPLIPDFCAEATEHLEHMAARLLDLEESGGGREIINDLFRAIHTVKGGARLLSIKKMEALAHDLENLLGDLRSGKRKAEGAAVDLLIEANKALIEMTREVSEHEPLRTPIDHLRKSINALRSGVAKPAGPLTLTIAETKPDSSHRPTLTSVKDETLRVPTSKLDDVLNTASEVFVTRIRLQSDVASLTKAVNELQNILQSPEFSDAFDQAQQVRAIASAAHRELSARTASGTADNEKERLLSGVRQILDLVEPTRRRLPPEDLKLRVLKIDLLRKQLQKNVASLEALSGRLQSGAMNFRMVPISQLFNRFPPLVRDMARNLGKRARLDLEGSDTELDKVLISQLVDPLIHVLRNALDHGLETPSQRLQNGKPEVGRIRLAAYYEGSYVVIEIRDDGQGIDIDRVLARALESGLMTAERAKQMSSAEIINLIFEPGFSTKTAVSELSGRGVGMDVVKTAVQEMQGSISVDSDDGKGTRIRIKMPLTLAVVSIVLVEEHGYQFAIPVLNVVEVLSIPRDQIQIFSGAMITSFRGRVLPVTSLSAIMGFSSSNFLQSDLSIVVLSDGDRDIGIVVDRLLGRHDVLIKRFGSLIDKLPYLMGCTILSDSRLVSVLNVWELIHNDKARQIPSDVERHSGDRLARRRHSILVVDDSPIQRNRVAAALMRAGYRAVTAEDGLDALYKVREHSYSACCVDVFMPIIDGLEFVERLRETPETSRMVVYMMSGAMEQLQDQPRIDQLKIEGFFRKPFDVEKLIGALDTILCDQNEVALSATTQD